MSSNTPAPLARVASLNSASKLIFNSNEIATNSFSNLNNINQSVLCVNVKEINLKLYNEIVVSWNICDDETSVFDFIGLYKLGIYILEF